MAQQGDSKEDAKHRLYFDAFLGFLLKEKLITTKPREDPDELRLRWQHRFSETRDKDRDAKQKKRVNVKAPGAEEAKNFEAKCREAIQASIKEKCAYALIEFDWPEWLDGLPHNRVFERLQEEFLAAGYRLDFSGTEEGSECDIAPVNAEEAAEWNNKRAMLSSRLVQLL